ncbi:MAG: DUF2190 family protein [Candidatus Bathyarchaeia archaeon]
MGEMAAGEVAKEEGLVVEKFTVKANQDITKGKIVWNDGNGVLTAANTAKGPFFVPLEDHVYSEASTHEVRCVVRGFVRVMKASGTAIKKGQYVAISSTAGVVTLFDYTTPGNWYTVVGTAMEDAAAAATEVLIWIGER